MSYNFYEQKAWEVAQAPFKNLMMMGFMMWMAGSTVHLFSIGITFSALWQPISALQGVGKGKALIRTPIALFLFTFPCSFSSSYSGTKSWVTSEFLGYCSDHKQEILCSHFSIHRVYHSTNRLVRICNFPWSIIWFREKHHWER